MKSSSIIKALALPTLLLSMTQARAGIPAEISAQSGGVEVLIGGAVDDSPVAKVYRLLVEKGVKEVPGRGTSGEEALVVTSGSFSVTHSLDGAGYELKFTAKLSDSRVFTHSNLRYMGAGQNIHTETVEVAGASGDELAKLLGGSSLQGPNSLDHFTCYDVRGKGVCELTQIID